MPSNILVVVVFGDDALVTLIKDVVASSSTRRHEPWGLSAGEVLFEKCFVHLAHGRKH